MRRLSRIYIEAIAKRFIQAYMELPEIKTSQIYRIDPEIFLEKILNTNCRRRRKAGFSLCKNPGGTIRKGSGSRAFDSRSVVQERKPNSQ